MLADTLQLVDFGPNTSAIESITAQNESPRNLFQKQVTAGHLLMQAKSPEKVPTLKKPRSTTNVRERKVNRKLVPSLSTEARKDELSSEEKIVVEDQMAFEDGFKKKFKPYTEIINNLTKMQICETDFDLVFCTLSNDSKRILAVIMVEDEHYIINQYDSDSLKKTFSKELKGNYIKAKEIA